VVVSRCLLRSSFSLGTVKVVSLCPRWVGFGEWTTPGAARHLGLGAAAQILPWARAKGPRSPECTPDLVHLRRVRLALPLRPLQRRSHPAQRAHDSIRIRGDLALRQLTDGMRHYGKFETSQWERGWFKPCARGRQARGTAQVKQVQSRSALLPTARYYPSTQSRVPNRTPHRPKRGH